MQIIEALQTLQSLEKKVGNHPSRSNTLQIIVKFRIDLGVAYWDRFRLSLNETDTKSVLALKEWVNNVY